MSYTQSICGGWNGTSGGAEPNLIQLANGPEMQQREKMVREFADIFRQEKIDIPQSNDIKELGQAMAKVFQDKNIREDKRIMDLLDKLVNKVNSKFGNIIKDSMTVEVKASQVLDFIVAITTGMHTELLAVRQDIQNIINNLTDLRDSFKISTDELNLQMEGTSDPEKLTELRKIRAIQTILENEMSRQLALLTTITGTYFTPAEEATADLLTHNKKVGEIIQRINATSPGKGPYAETMLSVFKSMANAAVLADKINTALKGTGTSIEQFKSIGDNPQKMTELLTEEFKNIPMGADQSENRKKLVAFLVQSKKLMEELDPKYYSQVINILNTQGATTGGYMEVEKKEMKTNIQKQVEALKESKKVIMQSFNREFSVLVKGIYNSIDALGQKSGDGLMPISDALENFIKNLTTLNDLQRTNIFWALSGVDQSQTGKRSRDNYIEEIKVLNTFVEQMIASPDYSGSADILRQLKGQFDALINLIGTYVDKVGQIWGGETTDVNLPTMGGAPDSIVVPEYSRSVVELESVIKKFVYFFQIAQIRRNLGATSKEIDTYGADYERMLGQAISQHEEQRKKQLLVRKATIDSHFMDVESMINNGKQNADIYLALGVATGSIFDTEYTAAATDNKKKIDVVKKYNKEVKRIFDEQEKTKVEFYRVVQAIDLYAKNFTSAAVKNPDAMKNLKNELMKVEIIAKFFNDDSGESLARLFDLFNPKYLTAVDDKANRDKHYYEKIAAELGKSDAIETHLKGLELFTGTKFDESYYDKLCEQLKKTVESVTILKNIVNVFTAIGDKFNDTNISKEVFMSPVQIYNALVDFIVKSSIEYNFQIKQLDITNLAEVTIKEKIDFERKYENEFRRIQFYATGDVIGAGQITGGDGTREEQAQQIKKLIDGIQKIYADLQKMSVFSTPSSVLVDNQTNVNNKLTDIINLLTDATTEKTAEVDIASANNIAFYKNKIAELNKRKTNVSSAKDDSTLDTLVLNIKNDVYHIIQNLYNIYTSLTGSAVTNITAELEKTKNELKNAELNAANAINELADLVKNGAVKKAIDDARADADKANAEVAVLQGNLTTLQTDLAAAQKDINLLKNPENLLFKSSTVTSTTVTSKTIIFSKVASSGLIMSGTYLAIDNSSGLVANGNFDLNLWKDEMDYFAMILKTMIAKTFITIGYYDLLERPGEIPSLAPIRMILGGADEYPKIEDGAIELYIRLPLLAEYYRELFKFDDTIGTDKNDIAFSMLPEMDGTFSKLIKMIFKTTKYINVGTYTENDTKELILIINEIYNKFAGEKNPINSIIDALVAEVNRRYGIIMEKDRKAYTELYYNKTTPYDQDNLSKISLLQGEEELQVRKSAPSDTYASSSNIKKTEWIQENRLDPKYRNAFRKFRAQIDTVFDVQRKQFEAVSSTNIMSEMNKMSFKDLINQARVGLKRAQGEDKRYEVAAKLIQDVSSFTRVDNMMSVMFHETVLVGLNVLQSIYQYLRDFRDIIERLNIGSIVRYIIANAKSNYTITEANIKDQFTMYTNLKDFDFDKDGKLTSTQNNENNIYNVDPNKYSLDIKDKDKFKKLIEAVVENKYNFVLSYSLLIETIITHANDLQDLITIKFSEQNLFIDYNNLIPLIKQIFDSTKLYYQKFRSILTPQQRKDLEDKQNSGSIYFLEENLIDDLLYGNKKEGEERTTNSINKLNEYLAETFKWHVDKRRVHVTSFALYTTDKKDDVDFNKNYYMNYSVLITYQPNLKINTGLISQNPKALSMLETRSVKNKIAYLSHMGYGGEFYDIQGKNLNNRLNSVLGKFNNLLFNLILNSYDMTTRHIYAPLINIIVNSSLNSAILGNDVIPDATGVIINPNNDNGLDMKIQETDSNKYILNGAGTFELQSYSSKAILVSSLAAIIRNLQSGFSTSLDKKIATESLADLPLFVREQMKANLPVYEKLFEMLRVRCNILRITLEKGAFIDNVKFSEYNPSNKPTDLRDGQWVAFSEIPEHGLKQRYQTILNLITDGCQTVVKAIRQTLTDLNDAPKYMEFSQDFMADYVSSNGKQPLTLLSSLLTPLRNDTFKDLPSEMEFMPLSIYGTLEFKYLYGTRGILRNSNKVSPDIINNFENLISLYNAMINPIYSIDQSKFNEFSVPIIKLSRYLIDTKQYKSWLSTFYENINLYSSKDLFIPDDIGYNADGNNRLTMSIQPINILNKFDAERMPAKYSVYQVNLGANTDTMVSPLTKLEQVINITESRQQQPQLKIISRIMMPNMNDDHDRATIRIYNILDMNIVPINVHAMMRDIPLVNLLNYSWTFDTMICDLLNINTDVIDPNANVDYRQSESRFMTRLISMPYQAVTYGEYNSYMKNIFRGYNDNKMGRPKYLSDQIYNKTLFGEVYSSPYQWNKRGPQANKKFDISNNAIDNYMKNYKSVSLTNDPEWRQLLVLILNNNNDNYRQDIEEIKSKLEKKLFSNSQISGVITSFNSSYISKQEIEITYNNDKLYLTYMDNKNLDKAADRMDPNKVVKVVKIDEKLRPVLNTVSKLRFDTNLIRSLTFLSLVHRLIIFKIDQDLTAHRDLIIHGNALFDQGVVDYALNRSYTDNEYQSNTAHNSYQRSDHRM